VQPKSAIIVAATSALPNSSSPAKDPSSEQRLQLARLFRGSGAYTIATLVQRGLPFVLLPALASAVGPRGYGQLTLILTASAGVVSLLSFGLETHVFRVYYRYANDPDERIAQINTAGTVVLGAPIGFAGLLALGGVLVGSVAGLPAGAVGLGLLAVALQTSAQAFPMALLRAQERVSAYVAACAVFAVVNVGLSILLILVIHGGTIGWLTANFVASGLYLGVAMRGTRWRFQPRLDSRRLREALAFGVPLMPHQMSHWALGLSDRLIVGIYCTTFTVGVYSLAAQLALPVGLLVTAIQLGTMPEYGRVLSQDARSVVLSKAVTISVAAVAAVGAGMALLGPCVIALLMSPRYAQAVTLLPWISLGYTFFGLYLIPMNSITVVAGRTQFVWIPTLFAAVATVGLNFLLIPSYGVEAAAVVSAVGYAVLLACVAILSWRLKASVVEYQWGPILAILGASLVGYFLLAGLGDPRTASGAAIRLVGWGLTISGAFCFAKMRAARVFGIITSRHPR
jgi:O-antigen/teichoic acid export membrane protein